MKQFRLTIDGVDKIGKTFLLKKIFKDLDIKDISYSKSSLDSKEVINLYKKDYNIIENSISYRVVELKTLFFLGEIGKKEYLSSMKRYQKNLFLEQSYLHIYLYSSYEFIKKNRNNKMKNSSTILDKMILENLINFYKENQIYYIIINVEDKTDLLYFRKVVKHLSSTKKKRLSPT